MKKYLFFLLTALAACNISHRSHDKVLLDVTATPFQNLSDYGFFAGNVSELKPNKGVVEYSLINTMFNDFARKKSFVYVPEGKHLETDSTGRFIFPEGSCLINCVYYLRDERDENKGKLLVETQLLAKEKNNWVSRNYVWNEEQSNAELNIVGDSKKVKWLDKNGSEREVDFVIAGKNQCKSCHNSNGELIPIGFTAEELNHKKQLDKWNELGLLPPGATAKKIAPHVFWKDTSALLNTRVRAYLHINCAYCHSEKGPAKTSGLLLNFENQNMETFGVCKTPPSAGRGSCNLRYDIVPGKPGESIIVCRMAATDLETKMPELGRTTTDNEGVSLIINWILQLKGDCNVGE